MAPSAHARKLRILLLTHAFNGLSQRLHLELRARGHTLAVEFDIHDAVAEEGVRLFEPDLVVAPFLKRAIPASIWQRLPCLIVHPGIVGDRGPSALDRAIERGETQWGVTVLQANAEFDAGDIWATRSFAMRAASKSSLYRRELTEAATEAVLEAVSHFAAGGFEPTPLARWRDADGAPARGQAWPLLRRHERCVDWASDDTATVVRRIRAADAHPGLLSELAGVPCRLFDAHPEARLRGRPGALLAQRHGALCRATADGAVWITHARREGDEPDGLGAGEQRVGLKLPATLAVPEAAAGLPELALPVLPEADDATWQDIRYERHGWVGVLHWDFLNGAMATDQLRRARAAFIAASQDEATRVIVLAGGRECWSNGIHLHRIEAAASPADASLANIEAMDDLCEAILRCDSHGVIAALGGNAGAGGVFLALAAHRVWARRGVVLNPHYKGMGNLYGSEYWTYLLPRRVGAAAAAELMQQRLPMGAVEAADLGLVDDTLAAGHDAFAAELHERARAWAASPALATELAARAAALAADEAVKPLAAYRAEELALMRRNFYGFDPSYHVARYHFVHRLPHAWTPLHLAAHRRRMWARQDLLARRSVPEGAA